jgi:hypothetical protein
VPRPDLVLVVELLVFVGFAFAVISSLHSYLIAADQTGTVRPPPISAPQSDFSRIVVDKLRRPT